MLRKTLLFLLPFILLIQPALSQKYGTTFGLRFANGQQRMIGLSAQQRIFKHVSFEGILQTDFQRNTTAHGLLKRHYPVLGKRLNFYGGAGISLGNEESTFEDADSRTVITTYGNKTIGADLMVGAELTILGLNVSLDYKPNFNIVGKENWYDGQVGISVRTVLIKDKQFRKNKRKRDRQKRRDARRENRNDST
jgi:hypothetical protein